MPFSIPVELLSLGNYGNEPRDTSLYTEAHRANFDALTGAGFVQGVFTATDGKTLLESTPKRDFAIVLFFQLYQKALRELGWQHTRTDYTYSRQRRVVTRFQFEAPNDASMVHLSYSRPSEPRETEAFARRSGWARCTISSDDFSAAAWLYCLTPRR